MLAELLRFSNCHVYFIFICDRIKIPILYQHVLLKDGTVKFAFVLCLFSLTDLCKSIINIDLGRMNMSTKDNRIPLKHVLRL